MGGFTDFSKHQSYRRFSLLGIFHNQVPAVITFPPAASAEETVAQIPSLTTITPDFESATWQEEDDEYSDFVIVPTSTITPSTTTHVYPITSSVINPIPSSSSSIPELINDDFEFLDPSSTIAVEHFDFFDGMPPSSTISGGAAIAQDESELNWWDLNDVFTPSVTDTIGNVPPVNSSPQPISTSTLIPSVTRFEHLSHGDADENSFPPSDDDIDMNDYFSASSTPNLDQLHKNDSFVPYYFNDYKPHGEQQEFLNLIKPVSTLAMPPFSWMLQQANRTQRTSSPPPTTKKLKLKNRKMSKDQCQSKRCQHGGRLNHDCLCICLPAFTGDQCQTGKLTLHVDH